MILYREALIIAENRELVSVPAGPLASRHARSTTWQQPGQHVLGAPQVLGDLARAGTLVTA